MMDYFCFDLITATGNMFQISEGLPQDVFNCMHEIGAKAYMYYNREKASFFLPSTFFIDADYYNEDIDAECLKNYDAAITSFIKGNCICNKVNVFLNHGGKFLKIEISKYVPSNGK